MILEFLKDIFEQLSQCDKQEQCENEEDKRASTFQTKVFMRFALMHFYMHQLASIHRTTVETHQHCGNQVEKLMIAFSSLEKTHAVYKENTALMEERYKATICSLEQRQMEMSTQLLLTRIDMNKENLARQKTDGEYKQVCSHRDQIVSELESVKSECR